MNSLDTINPRDWNTIAPHFEALQSEELPAERVPGWLERWSDLERVLSEALHGAERAKSENTADAEAETTYLYFVQEIGPKLEVAAQALKVKLLAVPDYTPGDEEAHLLRRLRSEADLFREANVPLQAKMAATASEYDKIVGAMTVTLDGREQTLDEAAQALLEPQRDTREAAWRAMQTRWLEDRGELDTLFQNLLDLRRQLAENAGLPNYRAFRWQELQRFDYTPEDSLAFGRAIESAVVPLAAARRERQRRQMGLDTLRPWDVSADPLARPPLRPFTTVAALEEGGERIFAHVAPELGAQYARLRAGFLDLGSRRNKAPGGFCSFFPQSRLPYIFMNAVGTHDDVQTLLHEGGHAFHDLASSARQKLVWSVGAPAEFAEVASMGMELLAAPYLEEERGGFYSPEDAERARTDHLEHVIQFLPYMAVVDGFQHWVYTDAPPDVTAAQMDAQWDALWMRFLPDIDYRGLERERRTGWHRKVHLYQYPFYYVEYGIAQLGALQVWRNALANQGSALRAYRDALALGNTRPLPELFRAAGAKMAFDAETVSELMSLVAAHLQD